MGIRDVQESYQGEPVTISTVPEILSPTYVVSGYHILSSSMRIPQQLFQPCRKISGSLVRKVNADASFEAVTKLSTHCGPSLAHTLQGPASSLERQLEQ